MATRCETHDEHITDQELLSPVEVTAPGVIFERCRFKVDRPAAHAPDDRRADAGP